MTIGSLMQRLGDMDPDTEIECVVIDRDSNIIVMELNDSLREWDKFMSMAGRMNGIQPSKQNGQENDQEIS